MSVVLDSPSLSCCKWYNFCSVSSSQCSISSAHSLCGLPLLFFPSITPNIKFPVLTNSDNVSEQVHIPPYFFLHDDLCLVHSTEYCAICYFLCQFFILRILL